MSAPKEEVEREAEAVVDRLCGKGRFCATRELATHLPVTIVSNAIGLSRRLSSFVDADQAWQRAEAVR